MSSSLFYSQELHKVGTFYPDLTQQKKNEAQKY